MTLKYYCTKEPRIRILSGECHRRFAVVFVVVQRCVIALQYITSDRIMYALRCADEGPCKIPLYYVSARSFIGTERAVCELVYTLYVGTYGYTQVARTQ